MTEEDKQLISKYMGWSYRETDDKKWWNIIGKDGATHLLDANDAALCVQEMQKRGDWQKCCAIGFGIYFEGERPSHVFPENYIAWLFNAENFFAAMSQWLREGK